MGNCSTTCSGEDTAVGRESSKTAKKTKTQTGSCHIATSAKEPHSSSPNSSSAVPFSFSGTGPENCSNCTKAFTTTYPAAAGELTAAEMRAIFLRDDGAEADAEATVSSTSQRQEEVAMNTAAASASAVVAPHANPKHDPTLSPEGNEDLDIPDVQFNLESDEEEEVTPSVEDSALPTTVAPSSTTTKPTSAGVHYNESVVKKSPFSTAPPSAANSRNSLGLTELHTVFSASNTTESKGGIVGNWLDDQIDASKTSFEKQEDGSRGPSRTSHVYMPAFNAALLSAGQAAFEEMEAAHDEAWEGSDGGDGESANERLAEE